MKYVRKTENSKIIFEVIGTLDKNFYLWFATFLNYVPYALFISTYHTLSSLGYTIFFVGLYVVMAYQFARLLTSNFPITDIIPSIQKENQKREEQQSKQYSREAKQVVKLLISLTLSYVGVTLISAGLLFLLLTIPLPIPITFITAVLAPFILNVGQYAIIKVVNKPSK